MVTEKKNPLQLKKRKNLLWVDSFCEAIDQLFQGLSILRARDSKALDSILELDDKDRHALYLQSQYQPVSASTIQPVQER